MSNDNPVGNLLSVYHSHDGIEFTGTADECQEYIANYGGGWTALSLFPATTEEKEQYYINKNLKP